MAAQLLLRTEALDRLRERDGLTKDGALAAAMAVSSATVSRVLTGKAKPGSIFIPALVAAFPGTTLDDLFEVA